MQRETIDDSWLSGHMALHGRLYRLVGLDGSPHVVLDAPYDSIEAAIAAAKGWLNGQGLYCSLTDRAIGVEVLTHSGDWRTLGYQLNCLNIGLT